MRVASRSKDKTNQRSPLASELQGSFELHPEHPFLCQRLSRFLHLANLKIRNAQKNETRPNQHVASIRAVWSGAGAKVRHHLPDLIDLGSEFNQRRIELTNNPAPTLPTMNTEPDRGILEDYFPFEGTPLPNSMSICWEGI